MCLMEIQLTRSRTPRGRRPRTQFPIYFDSVSLNLAYSLCRRATFDITLGYRSAAAIRTIHDETHDETASITRDNDLLSNFNFI